MKAAVIGSPINHSLSPFIFSFIAWKEKRVIDYNKIEITEQQSQNFLEKIKRDQEYVGFNVTLPLKECFLTSLDILTPEVQALGAMNVMHFHAGVVTGHNTDIVGISNTFAKENFIVANKNCMILGAGGSARAVAYVLGESGAKSVVIFNRSDRNQDLVSKFQKLFPKTSWSAVNEIAHKEALDLIINTTPLGMTGKDSGIEFFSKLKSLTFNQKALAFDLIYTPSFTPFMNVMQQQGLAVTCGLGMLIDQAIATWKIWIGEIKDEIQLHKELRNYLNGVLWLRQNNKPIYLAGFMGVGKTTIAAEIAKQFNLTAIDTDTLIQTQTSMSVPEIFAQKGEAFFRSAESEVIREIPINSTTTIVSLGGGALVNEANLEHITDSGLLIYLSANVDTLVSRVSTQEGERPLLANLNADEKVKKITDLLSQRKSYYQKAAIEISTDNLNVEDICFNLISNIGKWYTKDHA